MIESIELIQNIPKKFYEIKRFAKKVQRIEHFPKKVDEMKKKSKKVNMYIELID